MFLKLRKFDWVSSGEVVRDLRRRLAEEVPLPSGIGLHFGGTAEDQEESFRQMGLMLVLGIRYASDTYFEAALLIALFGFVGSFALAKFLLRGEVIE